VLLELVHKVLTTTAYQKLLRDQCFILFAESIGNVYAFVPIARFSAKKIGCLVARAVIV
jgi:hypothetical protein